MLAFPKHHEAKDNAFSVTSTCASAGVKRPQLSHVHVVSTVPQVLAALAFCSLKQVLIYFPLGIKESSARETDMWKDGHFKGVYPDSNAFTGARRKLWVDVPPQLWTPVTSGRWKRTESRKVGGGGELFLILCCIVCLLQWMCKVSVTYRSQWI